MGRLKFITSSPFIFLRHNCWGAKSQFKPNLIKMNCGWDWEIKLGIHGFEEFCYLSLKIENNKISYNCIMLISCLK